MLALVTAIHFSSKRKGTLRMKSKTRDLFSPVAVISNGHRSSTVETTGFRDIMEMEVRSEEKEVPPQSELVETTPNNSAEKESATATEGRLMKKVVWRVKHVMAQ